MRPILMTMLSSVLGLVPMALGWGEGAEIRSPMAIAVIGGMAFSTMLTLIFIPVMYELLDRKRYPGDITAPAGVKSESMYLEGAASEAAGD